MRTNSLETLKILYYLKNSILISFLISFFISLRVWLGDNFREFPTIPLYNGLRNPNYPFDLICIFIIFTTSLLGIISSNPKKYLYCWLIILLSYSIFDQNRFQPYNYQFFLLILILTQVQWINKEPDIKTYSSNQFILDCVKITLIAVWFWSGVMKINSFFYKDGIPWFMGSLNGNPSIFLHITLFILLLLGPFCELGFAIFLLFDKTRKFCAYLLISMHTLILLALGPFGRDVNCVVWPWNVFMIIFCYLCFIENKKFNFRTTVRQLSKSSNPKVILLTLSLFTIAPILNFIKYWPDYLSFSLYSWAIQSANIVFEDSNIMQLPESARKVLQPAIKDSKIRKFSVSDWSYSDLDIPVFPSQKSFLTVFKTICKKNLTQKNLTLHTFSRPNIITGEKDLKIFSCNEL